MTQRTVRFRYGCHRKGSQRFPGKIAADGSRRDRLIAEQHVEDVVALLAGRLRRSRSGEGRTLGRRCDAIPVDHPGTWLDAAGDQVLRLGGRSGAAINDVAAGEARRAEEARPSARAVVMRVCFMACSVRFSGC